MSALIEVILPVFLVIGFGYVAVWKMGLPDVAAGSIMGFAQSFAFPVLLFRGVARLELSESFDGGMLTAFYTGVTLSFFAGLLGARWLFGRPWPDCVAVAFATAFSNGGLLGLPITERAYGTEALSYNFAIIAFHAPFVYLLGTVAMEVVRAGGRSVWSTVKTVFHAMRRNPMLIGIVAGALVNVSSLPLPAPVWATVDMVSAAAIPVALFGLGGVLVQYRPEGDLKLVAWISLVSLVIHPAIVLGLGHALAIPDGAVRSSVLMATMAPGVNSYIFANMYSVAKRVAATSVLVGTVLSIGTVWFWLHFLP